MFSELIHLPGIVWAREVGLDVLPVCRMYRENETPVGTACPLWTSLRPESTTCYVGSREKAVHGVIISPRETSTELSVQPIIS